MVPGPAASTSPAKVLENAHSQAPNPRPPEPETLGETPICTLTSPVGNANSCLSLRTALEHCVATVLIWTHGEKYILRHDPKHTHTHTHTHTYTHTLLEVS